jgi:predicted RNA-binding Zn-ribbon protein involved in translation (DUF1610 family)
MVGPEVTAAASAFACPHCGSAETARSSFGQLAAAALVIGSCAMWVPIVGWIVAPLAFLAMGVLGLMALLPGVFPFTRRLRRCRSCNTFYFAKP